MLYEIKFSYQSRDGYPDTEGDSIRLTAEQYPKLPELSAKTFDSGCIFAKREFTEQVRHPEKTFRAIWISNDQWTVEPLDSSSDWYVYDEFYWVFVCLDILQDIWIAFTYHDAVTADDEYCSTVSVSYPTHGEIYRLDEGCKAIVRKFY